MTFHLEVDVEDVVALYSALARDRDRGEDDAARTLERVRAQLKPQGVLAALTDHALALIERVENGGSTC